MAGKVIDKTCHSCIYCQGASDSSVCCNYFLITDNRRPCDPGKDCTVREKRKRKRLTAYDREQKRKEAMQNG